MKKLCAIDTKATIKDKDGNSKILRWQVSAQLTLSAYETLYTVFSPLNFHSIGNKIKDEEHMCGTNQEA